MAKILSAVLPPITTRDEALSAVKMAGLPVFLIGMGTFFLGFFQLLEVSRHSGSAMVGALLQMALGAALVLVSFRLRKGHPGFALLAFILTAANFSVGVLFPPASLGPLWVFTLIIQTVMVLLTLNGLRAWLWLRRTNGNGAA